MNESQEWIDYALALDSENRALRLMLTNVLIAVAQRDDLLVFGRQVIDERWPAERGTQ